MLLLLVLLLVLLPRSLLQLLLRAASGRQLRRASYLQRRALSAVLFPSLLPPSLLPVLGCVGTEGCQRRELRRLVPGFLVGGEC